MNKYEFMYRLSSELSSLNIADSWEIMDDYEEHFRLGAEAGKTDEEIVSELGDPTELARGYLSSDEEIAEKTENQVFEDTEGGKLPMYGTSAVQNNGKSSWSAEKIILLIAIILGVIFIGVPLISTLISIIVGIACTALGLLIGGIAVAVVLAVIAETALSVAGGVLLGIGVSFLGVVFGFLTVYSGYGLWKLCEWFFKLCKKAIEEA